MFGCALLKSVVGCVECSEVTEVAVSPPVLCLLWAPALCCCDPLFPLTFCLCELIHSCSCTAFLLNLPSFSSCAHHVQCPVCLNMRGDLSASNTHKPTGSNGERPGVHVGGITLCAQIW